LAEFIGWFVAPPLAAPEFGEAELCSAAPPDVSALPDWGCWAAFAASGETLGVVGNWPDCDSAAKAGARPRARATAVHANRCFIVSSLQVSRCVAKEAGEIVDHHLAERQLPDEST
jgi:hypothetical protein